MASSLKSFVPAPARSALKSARIAAIVLRPRKNLFLFSHMRSYSSLLGHILGSNPQIDGYSELQLSYKSELDLMRAAMRVYETNGNKLKGKYLFDKVLHGHLSVGNVVLQRKQAVAIFAVREPAATIRSTVAMAHRRKKPDWKGDVGKVAAYYERRTGQLVDLAEQFRGRSAALEAERLITDSDAVLAAMTEFLGLKDALRKEYEVFSHTGKPQFGDPGKNIQSGQLLTEREAHDEIEIDPAVITDLRAHRDHVLARLREICDIDL